MTNCVEVWAKEKLVEQLVELATGSSKNPIYKDLCQDIYLDLLQKSPEQLEGLVERQEYIKYLVGMIKKNIHSSTSPFYRTYRDYSFRSRELLPQDEELLYMRESLGEI